MIQELISTSSPQCLDGNAGFGVVARTAGMAPNVAQDICQLSGYSHMFPAGDTKNPVAFLHVVRRSGGVDRHIISRVADCGNDYSGRTNRIGHHLVIDESDVPSLPGGPTAIASQLELFCTSWNEKSQELPQGKNLSAPLVSAGICRYWRQRLGDAGWGEVVAKRIEKGDPVSILFAPGMNILPLLAEAFALLPPHVRWKTTFSTFFLRSQEPPGTPKIQVKCIAIGSDEVAFAKLTPNTLLIDLRQQQAAPPLNRDVEAARIGKTVTPFASEPTSHDDGGTYDLAVHKTSMPLATPLSVSEPTKPQEKSGMPWWAGMIIGLQIVTLCFLIYYVANTHRTFRMHEAAIETTRTCLTTGKDQTDVLIKEVKASSEKVETVIEEVKTFPGKVKNVIKEVKRKEREVKKQLATLPKDWTIALPPDNPDDSGKPIPLIGSKFLGDGEIKNDVKISIEQFAEWNTTPKIVIDNKNSNHNIVNLVEESDDEKSNTPRPSIEFYLDKDGISCEWKITMPDNDDKTARLLKRILQSKLVIVIEVFDGEQKICLQSQ
jgi:hypothetical protein